MSTLKPFAVNAYDVKREYDNDHEYDDNSAALFVWFKKTYTLLGAIQITFALLLSFVFNRKCENSQ